MPKRSCRTCRWRKERHRTDHPKLQDRIIHLCTHPDQRTILGVDWKGRIEADLGHCPLWEKMAVDVMVEKRTYKNK